MNHIDRKDILDKLVEFMTHDIQAAINGNANYLAALGLSTYTENLGGFLRGDLEHNLGCNYIGFIQNYFPPLYMTLDSTLWSSSLGGGLYRIIRCGLVHEYFMKADSTITVGIASPSLCGIVYNPLSSPKINFYVDTYFDHFKIALKSYYTDLVGTSSTIPNHQLQINFDNAYQKLPLYSVASKLAAVSGGSVYLSGGSVNIKGPDP